MNLKTVSTADFIIESEHTMAGILVTCDTYLHTDSTKANVNTPDKFMDGQMEVNLVTDGSTKTIIPKRKISDIVNASNFGGVNSTMKYFDDGGKIQLVVNWSADGGMLRMGTNSRYVIKFYGTPATTNKVVSAIRDEDLTSHYYTYSTYVVDGGETKEKDIRTKDGVITGLLMPFNTDNYLSNDFTIRVKFSNGASIDYEKEEFLFLATSIDDVRSKHVAVDRRVSSEWSNKSFYVDFSKFGHPVTKFEIINNTSSKLEPFVKLLTSL